MTISKWHAVTSRAIDLYLQVMAGWILWHTWASLTMYLVTEAGKMHAYTYTHNRQVQVLSSRELYGMAPNNISIWGAFDTLISQ